MHTVAPKGLIDYAVKWVWEPQESEMKMNMFH